MNLKDFKKACNDLLSSTFNSKYPVYGTATKDGYKRPSFFTELLPRTMKPLSSTMTEVGLTYKFTFLEQTHDEAACLDIVSASMRAFGHHIRAAGSWFVVEGIDYAFIDTNADVLQVSIDFATVRTVSPRATEAGTVSFISMDTEILSPDRELMARFNMRGE